MGAPRDSLTIDSSTYADAGRVYLFYGPIEGELTAGDADAEFAAASSSGAADEVGTALLGEDVTGDGIDDIVIGAPGRGSDDGAVYVWPGSATPYTGDNATTTATYILYGEPDDRFGTALTRVGAYGRGSSNPGSAYVVLSSH